MSVRPDRPYVVYWNNIPAPYMVERFNALADRGILDFEAWFNERAVEGRSWRIDESDWRFAYRYLPSTRVGRVRFRWPLPLLGRLPQVLVSLYAEPVFLAGWSLAKLRGARTAFWCVRTFDNWVSRSTFKELVKTVAFRLVDATLGPGEDARAFALRYGADPDRAWILHHSIDVRHFELGSAATRPHRETVRHSLGLRGTTFIYVGRLWRGKGIDHLIEAFDLVQSRCAEPVSLLLVGDGPADDALRKDVIDRRLENVVFAGFRPKSELPGIYAASDVFVFPTLGDPYGLVVDEAMASSLPIISTTAAGEIGQRVIDGSNGYLVPPADAVSLATRMLDLTMDPGLREDMGCASLDRIRERTPERWAQDFEDVVQRLLAGRR